MENGAGQPKFQHRTVGNFLPFTYEALPPPFYLVHGEILDEEILLNVQVECEHGSELGKVMAGETGSTERQLDGSHGNSGVRPVVAAAAMVVSEW
jgi:hypothetical protein